MEALPEDRAAASRDDPTRVTGPPSGSRTGEPTSAVMQGPVIEGYQLLEEIHRGGQGIVYRAIQLGTKRQVALKVLLEGPFASESTRRRFEREIELAASLRHPHIVTILDSGLSLGRYYFAMEYIDGVRLDRYVAQERAPLDDVLRLCEQICLAVNFAHQRGVIHRDLKPPNILVDTEGQPHILDFGLAKPTQALPAGESTVAVLSTSGQLIGTVAYMSPEQASGQQDVDVRTDVYSLGIVFYEALVGQPPYAVDGPLGEVLSRIARADVANPRSVALRSRSMYRIDDEVATILLKALEKEPQRRYQSAGDLARDLHHRVRGEPIEAKRASGLYMLKKALRRYRWHAATVGVILVMLFGFLVTLAVLLSQERDARQRADQQTEETRQAVQQQEQATAQARAREAEAMVAQQNLRRALVRQHIQRGDLALERSDLREARESYWTAYETAPSPAAMWALRRYYLQTSDHYAALATLQRRGPSRLSPDGRLVAAAAAADGIEVRALESEALIDWVHTPGAVELLSVADDGALAAAGSDWACAWRPGGTRPAVAAQISPAIQAQAVYALDGGESLLVVGRGLVRLLRGPTGGAARGVALRGIVTGPPDYAPNLHLLAIPTTAGAELVVLNDDGTLQDELVWSGSPGVRAVRFDADERLAILADAVYVSPTHGSERAVWTCFLDATPEWGLFDLRVESGIVVLATRGGKLALYRDGDLVAAQTYTVDRLEQVGLSAERRAVLTLDERGAITHWVEPDRVRQRQLVYEGVPDDWAAARDGSAVLLAVGRGQVLAYTPSASAPPELRTVLRPRLFGRGAEDLALAVSEDGRRAVIRDRSSIRVVTLDDLAVRSLNWADPVLTEPGQVAISDDGELVAVLARNTLGDRQRVVLWRWSSPAQGSADPPRAPLRSFDFVGALVREIVFLPHSQELLVARSNGQLLRLDPHGDATDRDAAAPRASEEPWLQLDSPDTGLALSRTGEYLAAACEDQVVRLISIARREVRKRIALGKPVSALAFNPHDDVLLIRTTDGTVHLFDPATGESLASWRLASSAARPLAAWVGEGTDAMLLADEGGVYEYRYAEATAVIERNRPYAREQLVRRALDDADFSAAWAGAEHLVPIAPQRGAWAQTCVLEAALRRATVEIRSEWLAAVWTDGAPTTYLRLGHAAYAGGRFDDARGWLRAGLERLGEEMDAQTLWRVAECDYLAEAYDEAEARLARVVDLPGFESADVPIAGLQRVAALVLAGRGPEARQVAARLVGGTGRTHSGDVIASTWCAVIAGALTGLERESPALALRDSLVGGLAERSLLFRDDEFFFAGEVNRQRGDLSQAAVQYQRCIDQARDEWPSNWARYRLAQLSPAAANPAPTED